MVMISKEIKKQRIVGRKIDMDASVFLVSIDLHIQLII